MNKSFIISGSGGQGILSIGTILANIFMLNGYHVTLCSSYGAEMRGGAVNCEINVSDKEINTLQNDKVDFVIALNQTSFDKFISKLKPKGTMIANSSMVNSDIEVKNLNCIFAPMSEEATKLGNIKMANSIALGILTRLLENCDTQNIKKGYEKVLHNKSELIENNLKAFELGYNYIKE